jgi:hypothetical protein
LVDEYRRAGGTKPITTIVLGCTHYPLVKEPIEREFFKLRETEAARALIAERLTFVNPGEYTAKELFRELLLRRLRLPADEKSLANDDAFYVTVGRDGPLSDERKYGRSPGRFDVVDVRTVPMSDDAASRSAVDVWRKLLPHVAGRLP